MSCTSCGSSPCGCSALEIPVGPRGFAGAPGPAPVITLGTPTALPPGSVPTAVITGTLGVYNIDFGLTVGDTGPAGAPGTNGINGVAYTNLAAVFTQPAIGGLVTITVGTTSWMSLGEPIYINGGGVYFVASNPLSATQIIIRNPGAADGFAAGVTGNAAAGVTVSIDGFNAQVTPSGRPGDKGDDGAPGASGTPGVDSYVGLTTTIPVAPPGPGLKTIFYTDNLITPTVFKAYFYTSLWQAGPNLIGAAGTLIVNTGGDPNVTLPAGPIGTYAIRTDVPSFYVKTGVSTWAFVVSLTPTLDQVAIASGNTTTEIISTSKVFGTTPFADTHTVAGSYLYDTQYALIQLDADVDIALGIDDSMYADGGSFCLQLTNIDAGAINITYAGATWSKKTGLSLPATLAAGETQIFHFEKADTSGLYCIQDSFVEVAV